MNLSAPIGDCGEYSSLFVALCRAAKIPARNKVGWVIFEETGNVNQHEWAEILGSNGTWYPMDTQYASLEEGIDPIETPYFGGFPEKRLVLTSGYNIPLKPKAEGIEQSDIEIPFAVRESISCLQPFAVSSPTDIFFEEEIRIGR